MPGKGFHRKFPNILNRTCRSILSNKPAKLLIITLPVQFFKNPAYNIIIYSVYFQQFRLAAFLINRLGHLIIKCLNVLVLSILHMKLFKRTINLELTLYQAGGLGVFWPVVYFDPK